ncbi:hypothetical protein CIPAW_07G103200 [Carya illinoinensis]|uniref:Uncharacterized protein n=1 Tax=Carya illinoinensis TaxID=32201 RepID=A0A8T1Q4D5_CARIL|nr:hypothetical protein CIPAW_07G103200 [Carya illinoinensis]
MWDSFPQVPSSPKFFNHSVRRVAPKETEPVTEDDGNNSKEQPDGDFVPNVKWEYVGGLLPENREMQLPEKDLEELSPSISIAELKRLI